MLSINGPWLRVCIAASASILGSMMIYVDVIWNRISSHEFSILKSTKFMGASLSISCGTLIMTALNGLLPEATEYILEGRPKFSRRHANAIIIPFFVIGVLLCQFMNFLVLRYTSRSVVSCPHDLDNAARPRKNTANHLHEQSPLLSSSNPNQHDCGFHTSDHSSVNVSAQELDPTGYSSAPFAVNEAHSVHSHQSQLNKAKAGNNADLLAIGLQTTLGISIHRVPEGLLLFAASQTNRQLGISIGLALTIHSFSEGFSIAAPLYGALEKRELVLLISVLLGCSPQIIGALIGSVIFHGGSYLSENYMFTFGCGLAVTAGFMLVISIQMVGSAYRYMSQTSVLYGVIAGVLLSLAARAV